MQRYFIKEVVEEHTSFFIEQEDLHHLKKVMRNKNGDCILCIDPLGTNYQCHIENIEIGKIVVDKKIINDSELDVEVTLVYAMPKGDKFEFVLQKAAELGVKRIVPLLSNRCVVKLGKDKFTKKKVRFQKILKEASEQSYRNFIPEITDMITIKELPIYLGDYNVVAYEETAKQGNHGTLSKVLQQIKALDKVVIIVGSEGGFEEKEIATMEMMGIQRCSLGKRILRSETAPLYMLSVIGFSREVQ